MLYGLLGVVVMALGLAVIVADLIGVLRADPAVNAPTPFRDRAVTLVFLGVVPVLAGSLFLMAWYNGGGRLPPGI